MMATLGDRGKGLGKATCFGARRGGASGGQGRLSGDFFMGALFPACGFRFGAGCSLMLLLAETWIDKARFKLVGGDHEIAMLNISKKKIYLLVLSHCRSLY